MPAVVDLLDRAIYQLRHVDDLLALKPGTARRWIDGYDRGGHHYDPVIRPKTTGDSMATWGEFVETRLLAEYRSAGATLQRLRPAIDRLRELTGHRYPLAHHATWTEVAGRELVLRAQDEADVPDLVRFVIRTDQVVLTDGAGDFERSTDFTGPDHTALTVRPFARFHAVSADPRRSAGEPTVRGVRTEVLGELFRTGTSVEDLASVYQLAVDQVEDALRYEQVRRARAA